MRRIHIQRLPQRERHPTIIQRPIRARVVLRNRLVREPRDELLDVPDPEGAREGEARAGIVPEVGLAVLLEF
jgi:hypothetical protein